MVNMGKKCYGWPLWIISLERNQLMSTLRAIFKKFKTTVAVVNLVEDASMFRPMYSEEDKQRGKHFKLKSGCICQEAKIGHGWIFQEDNDPKQDSGGSGEVLS